eukprot:9401340-Alexandrium_andersonii.AAC.1
MAPQPPDAGHSLLHRVLAQAPLAQDRARQNGAGVAVRQDKDGRGRLRRVLCEEAIVHCDLGNR